jgi:hypothetical protein
VLITRLPAVCPQTFGPACPCAQAPFFSSAFSYMPTPVHSQLILSAVGAVRLESCDPAFAVLGTLTTIGQIACGLIPIIAVYRYVVRMSILKYEVTTPDERRSAREDLKQDVVLLTKQPSSEAYLKVERDSSRANVLGGCRTHHKTMHTGIRRQLRHRT